MPVAKITRMQKTGSGEKDFAEKEVQIPYGHYDLVNPSRARRIIYDGIENLTKIVIEPGGKVENVRLAEAIAKELMARKNDLKIAPSTAPDNGEQAQLGE